MFDLRIRPVPDNSHEVRDVFAVHVSPKFLVKLGLQSGALVTISKVSGPPRIVRLGTLRTPENKDEKVVQLTNLAQRTYDLYPSDRLNLNPKPVHLKPAARISLGRLDAQSVPAIPSESFTIESLKTELLRLPAVTTDLRVEVVVDRVTVSFSILQINDNAQHIAFSVQDSTEIRVAQINALDQISKLTLSSAGIGGLREPQAQIQRLLDYFWCHEALPSRRRRGLLLHGCSGTGKSLLLESLCKSGWRSQAEFHLSVSKEALHGAFTNALDHQPAIIVIHDLPLLAPHQSSGQASSLSTALRHEFRTIHDARVFVVAACRSVYDIDQSLRGTGYFDRELEISIPNTPARAEILKIHTGLDIHEANPVADTVASRTHGYVGDDLVRLIDFAFEEAGERLRADSTLGEDRVFQPIGLVQYTMQDFELAMKLTGPTALREVIIETPQVRWLDIAGQEEVKSYLEKALMWPQRFPKAIKSKGIRPSNGLLLHGPPGCSKTMIAKAAATESSLPFVAVRGAELLSMYVGETERAIRSLFAKARNASPCIIFFDEMEAIATSRYHGSGSTNGVNTVTTLLNEMDGITGTTDIFVLGATNQLEMIDPAILRPGRLDQSLYVGPPNEAARRAILSMECARMPLGDVDLAAIAQQAEGMSGADVVELCQVAARTAMQRELDTHQTEKIRQDDFESAFIVVPRSIQKIQIGQRENDKREL